MCENSPINVVAQMKQPPCPIFRKQSNLSCRSGGGGSRLGLPVADCMKPSRKPNNCCNQARPDCCRVPCCPPPFPKCPQGRFVERIQPFLPDRRYKPSPFPLDGMSSYRQQFHSKCVDRAKPFKPVNTFNPPKAKMEGVSSYREAYTCNPVVMYQKPPWAKPARFGPPIAKMESFSTYRFDFKGCVGNGRVKAFTPQKPKYDPSTAKMEFSTTYRGNYIPYGSREYGYKQPPAKKQVKTSCEPMESVSSYRADFWRKCCAKRKNFKPNGKSRFSTSKFANRSTYRNDYIPFHFEKCVGKCIPARIYDAMYDCGKFACGHEKDPPTPDDDGDNCPPMGRCCPPKGGCCGNEMGLYPGPLPRCCRPDPAPLEGGDC